MKKHEQFLAISFDFFRSISPFVERMIALLKFTRTHEQIKSRYSKFSLSFFLGWCSILSAALITISSSAIAAVSVSDKGAITGSGWKWARGSSGGFGAKASANSIAMVGDGDCGKLFRGPFSIDGVYGDGPDHRGSIYGFGVQTGVVGWDDAHNIGVGMPDGWRVYGNRAGEGYTNGNVSQYPTANNSGDVTNRARTEAYGANSTAIGCDAKANGWGSNAIGWGAEASGASSLALGTYALASGQGGLAFGLGANATDEDTIAQGTLAKAGKKGAIAIGALTLADGKNAIAIGAGNGNDDFGASASVDDGVALGHKSRVIKEHGIALGSESVASTSEGVAGFNPVTGKPSDQTDFVWVSTRGSASVGDVERGITRQITGVAAGTQDTDAVNVAQLEKLSDHVKAIASDESRYLGSGANLLEGIAPSYNIQGANYDNVGDAFHGVDVNLDNMNELVDNLDNKISGIGEGFVNSIKWDREKEGVDVGSKGGNKTNKIINVAKGRITNGGTDAINGEQLWETNAAVVTYLGGESDFKDGLWKGPVYNMVNVDVGGHSSMNNYYNVGDALSSLSESVYNVNQRVEGFNDRIADNRGMIDIINDKMDATSGVAWDKEKDAVDVGGKGGNEVNKIINVAGGTVSEGSTEAVNGGQLWETNNRVGKLEDTMIDVAQNAVQYDKDKDGHIANSITLQGRDGSNPVTVTNVGDGKIEKDSKDAVNGGQLYDYTREQVVAAVEESKKYTDGRINDQITEANRYTDLQFDRLNHNLGEVRQEARQAAAIGLAAASLRYDDHPGKLSMAVGSGFWKNEGALSFGAGYTSEDGYIRSNLAGTVAGGNVGIGAGLSFTLN